MRVALVGAGHMGKIHLQKLAAMPGVGSVIVADTDRQAAESAARTHALPWTQDWRDLAGKVEAAVIATPTEFHYDIARSFLEAGAHVFIEKPITSTPDEARQLASIAGARGLLLQVGHLERFNPAFKAALNLIESPVYIESHRLSPFTGRSVDIDVVLDLMIHDIDLAMTLVKSDVVDVRAQGIPFLIDKIDAAAARIEFANGAVASLNASRVSVKRERSLTVYERWRYFFIDMLVGKVTIVTRTPTGGMASEEVATEKGDAVYEELSGFLSAVASGHPTPVTADDGLKALEIANRITGYIADRPPSKTL